MEPSDVPTSPVQKSLLLTHLAKYQIYRLTMSTVVIDLCLRLENDFWNQNIKKELREYERYGDVYPNILALTRALPDLDEWLLRTISVVYTNLMKKVYGFVDYYETALKL